MVIYWLKFFTKMYYDNMMIVRDFFMSEFIYFTIKFWENHLETMFIW